MTLPFAWLKIVASQSHQTMRKTDLDEKRLKTLARALPATSAHFLHIPAHEHQPKREVFLQMRCAKSTCATASPRGLLAENGTHGLGGSCLGNAPTQIGQEPLEWIRLPTIPVMCPASAWEVVQWYRWRWQLEDFHKALKTGCRMEQRFLQSVEALWKLLAVLTPIALRLLLIRQAAQQDAEMPASEVVSQEIVRVVIYLQRCPERLSDGTMKA